MRLRFGIATLGILVVSILLLPSYAVADDSADLAMTCQQLSDEIRSLESGPRRSNASAARDRQIDATLSGLSPELRRQLKQIEEQSLDVEDEENRQARIAWLSQIRDGKNCVPRRRTPLPVNISVEPLDRRQRNLIHCDSVFQTIGLSLLRNASDPSARPILGLYTNLGQSNVDLWREAMALDPADSANPNLFYRKRDTYLRDYYDRNVENYAQLRGDYDQCINSHIFPGPNRPLARRSDYYRN